MVAVSGWITNKRGQDAKGGLQMDEGRRTERVLGDGDTRASATYRQRYGSCRKGAQKDVQDTISGADGDVHDERDT